MKPRGRSGLMKPLGALWIAVAVVGLALAPTSSARNVTKCIAASSLLPGSRSGVIRAAKRQAPSFQVRLAGHAAPNDLNYELLASSCSRAMVQRAWYTDLHPPGLPCGACDSHEYLVLLRHGGWATLGYFAG